MAINLKKTILVTGGTGFIGSHTCVALLEAGYDVLVLDNLSNSSAEVIQRIQQICGSKPAFIEGDIRDQALLKELGERESTKKVAADQMKALSGGG